MKYGRTLSGPIFWAITTGRIPGDIARQLQDAIAMFKDDTNLFDSVGLSGPVKHAELIIKLGYWLSVGQMTEKEFRLWADCIPEDENLGWDVDLLHSEPGSPFQRTLKMGPLATRPASCLIQQAEWAASMS